MVPVIYAYKEEVEQYAGKGNIILIEDKAPSHKLKLQGLYTIAITYGG